MVIILGQNPLTFMIPINVLYDKQSCYMINRVTQQLQMLQVRLLYTSETCLSQTQQDRQSTKGCRKISEQQLQNRKWINSTNGCHYTFRKFMSLFCTIEKLCIHQNKIIVVANEVVVQIFNHHTCVQCLLKFYHVQGCSYYWLYSVWLTLSMHCIAGPYCQLFSLCINLIMPCVWVVLWIVHFVSDFDHVLCAGLTAICKVCV